MAHAMIRKTKLVIPSTQTGMPCKLNSVVYH